MREGGNIHDSVVVHEYIRRNVPSHICKTSWNYSRMFPQASVNNIAVFTLLFLCSSSECSSAGRPIHVFFTNVNELLKVCTAFKVANVSLLICGENRTEYGGAVMATGGKFFLGARIKTLGGQAYLRLKLKLHVR